MALLLLALFLVVCVALIPLGLPGIWLMLAAAVGYNVAVPTGAGHIGIVSLVGAALLGVAAEVIDFLTSARYAEKYGGSRRAGWGAIVGGFVGAIVGVPVPIVGSVIGGFVGSFVGAFVAEWTRRDGSSPARVATGAVIGRAVGAAIKVAFGLAIAVWLVLAALA